MEFMIVQQNSVRLLRINNTLVAQVKNSEGWTWVRNLLEFSYLVYSRLLPENICKDYEEALEKLDQHESVANLQFVN